MQAPTAFPPTCHQVLPFFGIPEGAVAEGIANSFQFLGHDTPGPDVQVAHLRRAHESAWQADGFT